MGTGAGRYTGQELNTTSPLRRDTIVIPAYSWLVLRFITDNRKPRAALRHSLSPSFVLMIYNLLAGLWAFHCHIAWHMAAGLLMQFSSLPSTLAGLDVPQDIAAQCAR